jgi:hypothetical protein
LAGEIFDGRPVQQGLEVFVGSPVNEARFRRLFQWAWWRRRWAQGGGGWFGEYGAAALRV